MKIGEEVWIIKIDKIVPLITLLEYFKVNDCYIRAFEHIPAHFGAPALSKLGEDL